MYRKQRKQNRGRKRNAAACAGMICSLSIAITGCGQDSVQAVEKVAEDALTVQVTSPALGELALQNEFVGTVTPEESVYVISKVSAEVLSTEVSVGDQVEEGQILCQLDSEAAELQMASAKVQQSSAQMQVKSAQASVNTAEAGLASAKAQVESTNAQLDAQLGGQKNLNLYQLQIQEENMKTQIGHMEDQLGDLKEDIADARDDKSDLKDARDAARSQLQQAQTLYAQAQAEVAGLEPGDYETEQKIIKEQYNNDQAAYEYELDRKKEALKQTEDLLAQAQSAASALESGYEQAKQGIEQAENTQEQLENSIGDAYQGLQQTEAIFNITNEQVYSDTEKVIAASKAAAATGLQQAETTVDTAKLGVEASQIGVEGAQIAVDSAQYQLDMYTLTAPISGVVEAVNVDAHGFATPQSPAFVISDKSNMKVTFSVSSEVRKTLEKGDNVHIDQNGEEYEGTITEIGSMTDQATGLFQVEARISDEKGGLMTGTNVKVLADTYRQEGAYLVPYDTVYYDESQAYVYVAENGEAKRRDVSCGIFDEETMTVLEGISEADQVIVTWSSDLRDGVKIKVQETPVDAAQEEVSE